MQKNNLLQYPLFIIIILLISSGLYSCTPPVEHFPEAIGRPESISIVTDPRIWNGKAGEAFRKEFESAFLLTPQPEDAYDMRYIPFEEFNQPSRTLRTIIFLIDLSNKESPTTKFLASVMSKEHMERAMNDGKFRYTYQKDRWANGQLLIFWFAPDMDFLAQDINLQHERIKELIKTHDDNKYKQIIYNKGKNLLAMDTLKQKFNISIDIPREYTLATHDSVMMWFRFETDRMSSNIFLHKFPANTPINHKNLKELRNTASKKYLSTNTENSYVYIDDVNLPIYFNTVKLGNVLNVLEARGIWAVYNDFMGGSFISYLVNDSRNNQVLLIDVFVHMPGAKKRTEMRKLENIVSTLKVLKTETTESLKQ